MQGIASRAGGAAIEAGPLRWTSASRSHVGRVRLVNEDAWLEQPERGSWAVADGMGGHALGEFASRLAIKSLSDLPAPDGLARYVDEARERLQDANRRLRCEAALRDVPVIGTTIAALLASGRRCACLWAGDSRVYRYRDARLQLLTRDHSELEAARSRHDPASEDTLHRPPTNLITRALGATDTLEVDVATVDVADGDLFLVCSDGLTNEVSEPAIEQALLPGNCRHAAHTLVELALARGGHDNVTVVVVRAEDPCSPDRTAMHPVLAPGPGPRGEPR